MKRFAVLITAAVMMVSTAASADAVLIFGPEGYVPGSVTESQAIIMPGQGETWVEWPDEHTEAALESMAHERVRDSAYSEAAEQYIAAARWYKDRNETDHMIANLLAAADHNSADAFYELAHLHVEGVYLPLNFESAAHYLESAASLGHAEAKRVYGRMLMRGDMGEPDHERGLALLMEASESSPRALGELGRFYAGQLDDVVRDVELGVGLIYQAAEMGDPESMRVMENVKGVPESITQAGIRRPKQYSIAGLTGDQVFAEAGAIMLRAQRNKSLDDEALAFALYSLAHDYLGHEASGKEMDYLEGVRYRMSEADPEWLISWRSKAREHLEALSAR